MKNNTRRIALKQLLLFTFGGNIMLDSCKTPAANNTVVIPHQPLKPVHVPAGAISKPADGTVAGEPKIRSEHTNGQFCCQEITLPPKQAGPPHHLHKELDEIMYVLEGSVQVLVGETITTLNAGDYHLRPHGIVHTFWNAGDIQARVIDMYPNQDFLSFFEELARIKNKLKSKGLALHSAEGEKLQTDLLNKFGIVPFLDLYPPLLEKYGLKPLSL